jgi:hypothetical protein
MDNEPNPHENRIVLPVVGIVAILLFIAFVLSLIPADS